MAIFTHEDVLWFKVAVDDAERVEILEGDEDLGGEETRRREGEAELGLPAEEGVEVAAGAEVHEKARVMRNVDTRVESGEEGVVQRM